MIELAESINNFLPSMQQVQEQPSEESVFVLSSSQLQEIISRVTQPLQDRIDSLEDRNLSGKTRK